MDPFSVAALLGGGIGNIIGGKKKAKAAKKQQKRAVEMAKRDYSRAMENRAADQADVEALTRADEARARAAWEENDRGAGGYDFKALVKEAEDAGFNPLTALQMTGAANYAREAAPVLTTPFFARPQRDTVSAFLGTSQARVDNAGYVGDAIAGMSSGLLDLTIEKARNANELAIAQAYLKGQSPGPITSATVMGAPVNTIDARPVAPGGMGPGFAGPVFGTPGDITTTAIDENDHLFRVVRGKDGQYLIQANMDVAADLETQIAAELNNGTLWQWGESSIRKNYMHERDYRLWAIEDLANRAITRASPSPDEQRRAGGYVKGPFGVWMRPRQDGGTGLRIEIR